MGSLISAMSKEFIRKTVSEGEYYLSLKGCPLLLHPGDVEIGAKLPRNPTSAALH
jgi:hypothetical protein